MNNFVFYFNIKAQLKFALFNNTPLFVIIILSIYQSFMATTTRQEKYWKTNKKYLLILIIIGFVLGFVFPVFLVHELNTIHLGGYPLGFWFAAQGSIITFVVLLFVYAWLMNRLDKKHGLEDEN